MKNFNIKNKIKIKSFDTHKQNYGKSFYLKKMINLKDEYREYHYEDEYGSCKIISKNNDVEIYRRGEINSKQVFKLQKITTFNYITKEFKGKYEIYTKKIDIFDRKIIIEYDIMDSSEVINTINLEISIEIANEENMDNEENIILN